MGVLSKSLWFAPIRKAYNAIRRQILLRRQFSSPIRPSGPTLHGKKPRVLVLGIYLANRPNTCIHLVQRFSESRNFSVTQAWAALNGDPPDRSVGAVTVDRLNGFVPKFCIMNRLLAAHDWKAFDYLIFVDDDIVVPAGFLDAFLAMQEEFDLTIAQPARTRNSYADNKFCRQRKGIRGRRTRFVEIGPLFSVRKDFVPAILPFDELSGMGWGYDFVWPVLVDAANLRMGIIDATPVDHSLRNQASHYSSNVANEAMRVYLQGKKYLNKQEAFTVIETFP